MVLDRWMVWPHLDDPVRDLGKDYGMPKYYEVVSDARTIPHARIHYTRCIRMDGVELPYWQRMAENYWGLSVIEPLFDRLIAFDSATQGAAQLVYRAHLRTLKVKQLREAIAFGGAAYQGIIEMVKQLRLYQANEGITLLDADDEFETHSYGFGGLSEVLIQFGQQLSGAAQIPLVRLFGQSPAGLNATGESDIRNYYDFINSMQEDRLRRPVRMLI
jgi:phage-related protein (TIGR01555 family)